MKVLMLQLAQGPMTTVSRDWGGRLHATNESARAREPRRFRVMVGSWAGIGGKVMDMQGTLLSPGPYRSSTFRDVDRLA